MPEKILTGTMMRSGREPYVLIYAFGEGRQYKTRNSRAVKKKRPERFQERENFLQNIAKMLY